MSKNRIIFGARRAGMSYESIFMRKAEKLFKETQPIRMKPLARAIRKALRS